MTVNPSMHFWLQIPFSGTEPSKSFPDRNGSLSVPTRAPIPLSSTRQTPHALGAIPTAVLECLRFGAVARWYEVHLSRVCPGFNYWPKPHIPIGGTGSPSV